MMTTAQPVYLIVDTNVFINDLDKLIELTNLAESSEAHSILTIVVPYIVIQELDSLNKTSNTEKRIVARSTAWLQSTLRGGRRVICQNLLETLLEGSLPNCCNNDDLIVDCVLFFGRSPLHRVMLWTLDRNLAVKAQAHVIPTVDIWRGKIVNLLEYIVEEARSLSFEKVMDWEATTITGRQQASPQQPQAMEIEQPSMEYIFGRLLIIAENAGLEGSMRAMLNKYIGPTWTVLLKDSQSTWSAPLMLTILDRHWNAVFANCLPRTSRSLITSLNNRCASFMSSSIDPAELCSFGRDLKSLLLLFGINAVKDIHSVLENIIIKPSES